VAGAGSEGFEMPIEEAVDERRHFIELVFKREVSGVEQ
jgi:hypothetical protein